MKCTLLGLLLFTSAPYAQVGDKVALPNFAIDRTEVTIGQFERYVRATGTITRAEKEGGGFEFGAGRSVGLVGLGESPMARQPAPTCPPYIWILQKRKLIAVGRVAVCLRVRNGKRQALPNCASRPQRLGRKAERILGLRATARKEPTRVTLIHGPVPRLRGLQNKA